jgi:ATP-dependent exoDNAse (exonuclease V) alpha subunit
VQVMSENPYRLARDIRGIGFKTADAIAMKLGIDKTAMVRVRAGISYSLTEAMDEGQRRSHFQRSRDIDRTGAPSTDAGSSSSSTPAPRSSP